MWGRNKVEILRIKRNSLDYFTDMVLLIIALGEEYVVEVVFNKFAAIIGFPAANGRALMYIVFGILFIAKLPMIVNNLYKKRAYDAWFVWLTITLYMFRFYFSDVSAESLFVGDKPLRILFFYYPIFLIFRSVTDYEILMKNAKYYAYVSILFCLYAFSRSEIGLQQGYDTHMTLGYTMTLNALILYNDSMIEKKRIWCFVNLALAIWTTLFVVSYGSRGSTVVLACFALYRLFRYMKKTNLSIWLILCAIVMIFFLLFRDQILYWILSKIGNEQSASRTIAWILQQDSQLDASGRDRIYEWALSYAMKRPIWGYGLFQDRVLMGTFSHNLFIEWMFNFGYLIGGFFSIYIVRKVLHAIFDENTAQIASVVGLYAFGQLMFSNSYLKCGIFWAALGIVLSAKKRRKTNVN